MKYLKELELKEQCNFDKPSSRFLGSFEVARASWVNEICFKAISCLSAAPPLPFIVTLG